MSNAEALEALRKVAEVAKLAGIRGQIDENSLTFTAGFTLANNRSQLVHVRRIVNAPNGSAAICIMSPCVTLSSGWLKGISKDEALTLLRANERLSFGRYGIAKFGDTEMVMASMDALLDSLDAAEFGTYVWSVATMADAYEAKHKQDKF